MKYLAVFSVLWLLAASSLARAQLQIGAQTERSTFLLYERVDLLVTVENNSDTPIVLDNNEGQPWLSFLVSKHNRFPVKQERKGEFAALDLKPGETKTLRVNLTPLFSFRDEGEYQAEAVVDLPGAGQMISQPVPFAVQRGHTVWSATRPVDSSQRVYSLVRFSPEPDRTKLYLRVEDPDENLVYANLALGDIVASVDPEVYFDPQGNVHILQPTALGTYLYSRADPNGKIEHQTIFKTYREIPPRLYKMADGNVSVMGGLAEDPDMPREKLSDPQTAKRALPVALPANTGTP